MYRHQSDYYRALCSFYSSTMCVQYAVENEELSQHLVAAKDAQRQLTVEVTFTLLCYDQNTQNTVFVVVLT